VLDVIALRLESYARLIQGLHFVDVAISSSAIQTDLRVNVVTSLLYKLVEVIDHKAKRYHQDCNDLSSLT